MEIRAQGCESEFDTDPNAEIDIGSQGLGSLYPASSHPVGYIRATTEGDAAGIYADEVDPVEMSLKSES